MKTQRFYLVLLLVFLTFLCKTYAQTIENTFMCGHELVMKVNEENFPGYTQLVKNTFDHAYKLKDDVAASREEIFKIPVVVHIVWKNNEENLDDSLIHSQLKVLNDAFRLRNANQNELRDIFKHIQADAEIEFELHDIKRVKTSADFALSLTGLPDRVKQGNDGGSSAADTDYFLNIWVCRIQPIPFIGGQILGYAYPPAGLAHWPAEAVAPSKDLEGVVIDFRVFGLNNPNKLTVNGLTHDAQGLTTVHEVGHYLGLRHIWGDGGGLFGLGDSCNDDDGVSDTPNQGKQSPGGCDKSANTCTDAMDDLPDMIENYMDYSGERCQNTFTKEQVAIMRSVLRNQRKLLTNTSNPFKSQKTIVISPNPFTSYLNIDISTVENTNLIINTMDGKIVLHKPNFNENNLDLSWLSAGLYFLTVDQAGHRSTVKLVKVDE